MMAWHLEARRMRAEGWKYIAIAAHFGKSETAVYDAINTRRRTPWCNRNRTRINDYNRKWMAEYRAREKANAGKIIADSSLPRLTVPVSIL
jgi:hypothetical protein